MKLIMFFKGLWDRFFQKNGNANFVPIHREPFSAPPVIPLEVNKPKRQYVARAKNLKYLLENIEASFDSIGCPTDWGWSHTNKDTVIGLRRMGPHVSDAKKTLELPRSEGIKVSTKSFSSQMFCSFEHREEIKDFMNPVFSYAVKMKKAPWCVEQNTGGIIYECGAAWRDNKEGKLFWGNWYVSISKTDGFIRLLQCIRFSPKSVGGGQYTQKYWGKTPMAEAGFKRLDSRKTYAEDVLREITMSCFANWEIMETHWKVSVKKDDQRVTWTVPYNETKDYFKDRDSSVIDSSGRKKKIIHHVVQHSRNLSSGKTSMVREHIRGISEFKWRAFEVSIVAPKFHLNAHEFDVSGEDEEDQHEKIKYLNTSKVGKLLADMESKKIRKPLPAIH